MQASYVLTDPRCFILRKTGLFPELRTEETLLGGKLQLLCCLHTNNVSCVREICKSSFFGKIAAPRSVQTALTEGGRGSRQAIPLHPAPCSAPPPQNRKRPQIPPTGLTLTSAPTGEGCSSVSTAKPLP